MSAKQTKGLPFLQGRWVLPLGKTRRDTHILTFCVLFDIILMCLHLQNEFINKKHTSILAVRRKPPNPTIVVVFRFNKSTFVRVFVGYGVYDIPLVIAENLILYQA